MHVNVYFVYVTRRRLIAFDPIGHSLLFPPVPFFIRLRTYLRSFCESLLEIKESREEVKIGVSNRIAKSCPFQKNLSDSRLVPHLRRNGVEYSLGVDSRKRHGGGSSTRGKVMRSVVSCLFRISARSVVEFRHERSYFTEKG